MSTAKIQSGDKVKVISGNYKGIIGVVSKVVKKTLRNSSTIKRVSVSGVPKITKYRKAQSQNGENYPGEMFMVERFMNVSNVALLNDKNIVSKIKIETIDGKKTRVYKKGDGSVVKPQPELEKKEAVKKLKSK